MLKETMKKNEGVIVNSKEMEVLQKHFPSCFDKDGKFDIKVFEELIKTEDVDIKKEGYSLDFLGTTLFYREFWHGHAHNVALFTR